MLFIVELMSGPIQIIMVTLVTFLFLQVVVSLSAFGRLIIHTGAMGRKRVLDPEFERYLLPSGLHASLLIKATERRRRRTSVVTQYRTTDRNGSERNRHDSNSSATGRRPTKEVDRFSGVSAISTSSEWTGRDDDVFHMSTEEERIIFNSAKAFPDPGELDELMKDESAGARNGSRLRIQSEDSNESVDELAKDVQFPRTSILTKTGSRDQCGRNGTTEFSFARPGSYPKGASGYSSADTSWRRHPSYNDT